MSTEKRGHQYRSSVDFMHESLKRQLADGGLDQDIANVWTKGVAGETDKEWLAVLIPRQHYKERTKKEYTDPATVDLILRLSNSDTVAAYDALVDEFNADLERIRKEKDQAAVRKFWERAVELIYKGKK